MDTTYHITLTKTIIMSEAYSNLIPVAAGTPSKVIIATHSKTTSVHINGFTKAATTTTATTQSTPKQSTTTAAQATTSYEASSSVTVPSEASKTFTHAASSDVLIEKYHSNNNIKLGMAIGFPLGIFVLIVAAFGTWYYLKHKKPKPETMINANHQFYDSKGVIPGHFRSESTVGFENPYHAQESFKANSSNEYKLSSLSTPIRIKNASNVPKRESNLFKRFSRYFSVHDYENSISPMFLKRFNLNKPTTPASSIGIESYYEKKLPKLPSLIKMENAGLKYHQNPSLVKMENAVGDAEYTVVKPYRKALEDEVTIGVGDRVEILKNHDDGWSNVRVVSTGKTGMVPKLCLKRNP